MDIKELRKTIRHNRRQLSSKTQQQHQQLLLKNLLNSHLLLKHKRIAIYLHNDGEVHTDLIIQLLIKHKRQVYLPSLYPFSKNKLWFLKYFKKISLINNRFNIPEPHSIKQRAHIKSLDIIFMPLVAFDLQGNRIGMGGGFYDRTLSHCKKQGESKKPLLIGLAHELQLVDSIVKQKWDIPLDAIITEKRFIKFSKAFL